jgi:prepilin-type N-terminal cleavage/methylation domain-containing protein
MTSFALHARARESRTVSSARPVNVAARSRSRAGYSLIEMMVVLVIAGIAMSISLPKFAAMRDRMSVRSAKQQFASYLATARSAAIRQGQSGQFHANANNIWSNVNQANGTNINVSRAVSLKTARGVTVTLGGSPPSQDSIVFDSRGMGSTGARTYLFTRNGIKDSICVSRLGLIAATCGQ